MTQQGQRCCAARAGAGRAALQLRRPPPAASVGVQRRAWRSRRRLRLSGLLARLLACVGVLVQMKLLPRQTTRSSAFYSGSCRKHLSGRSWSGGTASASGAPLCPCALQWVCGCRKHVRSSSLSLSGPVHEAVPAAQVELYAQPVALQPDHHLRAPASAAFPCGSEPRRSSIPACWGAMQATDSSRRPAAPCPLRPHRSAAAGSAAGGLQCRQARMRWLSLGDLHSQQAGQGTACARWLIRCLAVRTTGRAGRAGATLSPRNH